MTDLNFQDIYRGAFHVRVSSVYKVLIGADKTFEWYLIVKEADNSCYQRIGIKNIQPSCRKDEDKQFLDPIFERGSEREITLI